MTNAKMLEDGTVHRLPPYAPRAGQIHLKDEGLERELLIRNPRRVSASLVARDQVQRTFAMYRRELAVLALTQNEIEVLYETLHDIKFLTDNLQTTLWSSVADYVMAHSAEVIHDVPMAPFVRRLRGLTAGQAMAIVDLIEQHLTPQDTGA